jgi:hypothetical protein
MTRERIGPTAGVARVRAQEGSGRLPAVTAVVLAPRVVSAGRAAVDPRQAAGRHGKASRRRAVPIAPAAATVATARTSKGSARATPATHVLTRTAGLPDNGGTIAQDRLPVDQRRVPRTVGRVVSRTAGVRSCAVPPPAAHRHQDRLPTGSPALQEEAAGRPTGPVRAVSVPGSPGRRRRVKAISVVRPTAAQRPAVLRIARTGAPASNAGTTIGGATARKAAQLQHRGRTMRGTCGVPTGPTANVRRRSTRTSRETSSIG